MKKLLSLLLLMVVTAWGQIDLKKQAKSDCTTSWLFFSGTTGNINCDTNLKWDDSAKRLTAAGMDISKAGLASLNILGSGDSDNYSFINLGDAQTATKSWYLLHRKEATYQNDFRLTYWTDAPTFLEVFVCETTGQCSFGVLDPTAILHLKAGTAAAGTAPLKFASGTLLTTPEAGTVEFLSPNLHFTPVGTRKTFKWSDDAPAAHAASHDDGASDEVIAEDLATACTDVQVLGGDGSGGVECQADAGGDGVGYDEVMEEAAGLTKRAQVNFIGAGVTCVDNAGNTRTDCTIPGGGAATRNELKVTRTSGTVLTFNDGCTSSAPCNVRGYQFTANGTLTLSGSETGTIWLEVDESGNVDARHNITDGNLACSGCTKVASATGYSGSGWQGYTWPITSGAYDAAVGTFDKRNFAYQKRIINGTGINVTEGFDDATVAINTAVVPQFSDIQAGGPTYCASSDGSDTYTCALSKTLTAYTTGGCLLLNVTTNNTGAATVNVDTLGAKALKIISSGAKADPANNRIDADDLIKICYDGTDFIVQTSEDSGGGAGGNQRVFFEPGDALFPATNPAYLQCRESSAGAPRPKWCELLFTTGDLAVWQFMVPSNYSGTVTAGVQYKMVSGVANNTEWTSRFACLTPGDATDMDADSFATADASADDAVPGTAGYLAQHTWTASNTDSMAAGDSCNVQIERSVPTGTDATGDAELVRAYLSW